MTGRSNGAVRRSHADHTIEALRVAALRRSGALDMPAGEALDRIARLAAQMFAAPVALIAIVDERRVLFASHVGLERVSDGRREFHTCLEASIHQDEPFVVVDARIDQRPGARDPVAGVPGLVFYAGVPLKTRDVFNLGTLCVADYRPRVPSSTQLAALQTMAEVVSDQMNLRVKTARLLAVERETTRAAERMAHADAELAARYEQEHNIAQAFQHALLPQFLPETASVRLDAIYAAADERDLVGGDWYDAFALDDGRIVISIGDVGGHGLEAAVWMGKVSQSLRALTLVQTEPHELLANLDRLLDRYEANVIITAFIAVLDPTTGELRYSSAGHSPPFVRLADGTVRELPPGGLPLGVPIRLERTTDRMMLAPGSMAVLYTDGLTEATRDILEGERSVREALGRDDVAHAEHPARALRDAVLSRKSFDDVAILTISYGG